MDGVFINYRRDDSSGWANRLHRDLVDRLGEERVFRDLNLEPGINFREAITDRLRQCKVQLVLIGRHWLTTTDAKGQVRIQKTDDLVRAEIAIALARNIRVIPVLVQDADMPPVDELPEDIRGLAERNAVVLSDRGWDHEAKELIDVIARLLGVPLATRERKPPAPGAGASSPAKVSTAPTLSARERRSLAIRLWWFISTLLFIGFAILSFWVCVMLMWDGENKRGMLALFGACWGLVSWLPVARVVGLKKQGAHVALAALSWTVAWSFIVPNDMLPLFESARRSEFVPSHASLAQVILFAADGTAMFHVRLLVLAAIGSAGSLVGVYLRLMWNKELRREVPVLTVLWSLAVYLPYVVIVEVLKPGGSTNAEADLIPTFGIALSLGSCIAAGFVGYWDAGNSVVRAIRSIPQSENPDAIAKIEPKPVNPASGGPS